MIPGSFITNFQSGAARSESTYAILVVMRRLRQLLRGETRDTAEKPIPTRLLSKEVSFVNPDQLANTLDQLFPSHENLSVAEMQNILFSFSMYSTLKEHKTDLPQLPLVYIGSGSDVTTALSITGGLQSGNRSLILIDNHAATRDSSHAFADNQYPSMEAVQAQAEQLDLPLGMLLSHQSIEPLVQILASLRKLGVDVSTCHTQTDQDNANITFLAKDSTPITIFFRKSMIRTAEDLKTVLKSTGLRQHTDQFGLMAKGGGGSALLQLIADLPASQQPQYCVVDDPRMNDEAAIMAIPAASQDTTAQFFPGYRKVVEHVTPHAINWGYSAYSGPRIGSTETIDYQSRAVIAIK